MTFAVACQDYDYTSIWDKLNEHEARIEELETLCRRLNTNVESIQSIVTVLQSNDYITDIVKIMENGVEVGYSITFAQSGTITLYHGMDASAPAIGVKKASSGEYYWTINGEWLTDENGSKISATVQDPSADYITPQFTKANSERLKGMASDGFVQLDAWQLGYGYIGINAGKIPDINIRRAIMSAMNTSLSLEYYAGSTAKTIKWPMSMESWAYPSNQTAKPQR